MDGVMCAIFFGYFAIIITVAAQIVIEKSVMHVHMHLLHMW